MKNLMILIISYIIVYFLGIFTEVSHALITDWAREWRDRRKLNEIFKKTKKQMPELIKEIKEDLQNNKLIREFVILTNDKVVYHAKTPKFVYYEAEHENLTNKIKILENKGYIIEINGSNTPTYKMSEEFVDRISNL